MINNEGNQQQRIVGEITLIWDKKRNTLSLVRNGEKLRWSNESTEKPVPQTITVQSFLWYVETLADMLCRKIIGPPEQKGNFFTVTFGKHDAIA